MDGNEAQLAKIKDAIKKGELTKEIIERRLNAAIDAELQDGQPCGYGTDKRLPGFAMGDQYARRALS